MRNLSNKIALTPLTMARSVITLLMFNLLTACSSGGESTTSNPDTLTNASLPQSELTESTNQTTGITEIQRDTTDNGDFLPVLFDTETDLDLEYARAGMALIEQINPAFILPADINVVFADCGFPNAFYVPPSNVDDDIPEGDNFPQAAGGSIIMCHELTQLFSSFYSDKDQAVGASNFVLMHELGHALVNQLELPVLGIEESYVDGMAAVFLGEAGKPEGAVLAGWFFGSQPDMPFFDTHRAGPQRLGDLACWGVGADPSLIDKPVVDNIAQQLIQGGRNCSTEYIQQRDALNVVLGPHIRGSLSDIFNDTTAVF